MPPPVASHTERAFRIGVLGNGALTLGKLSVGWIAGSPALIADGWHSLADVVTNSAAWIAHAFSRRGPDEDHHYGHAKLEAFAGLLLGLLLIAGGIVVGYSALRVEPRLEAGWLSWLAFGVALGSIATNLFLARLAQRGADESGSAGLRALAYDNASDALSSVLVLIGVTGSYIGFLWPERIATFGIGLVIVAMGLRPVRDGFDILMDRVDPTLRLALRETAVRVAGVRGVQRIRLRPLGHSLAVDMEITVDGELTVIRGHEIAHSVERAVIQGHEAVSEVHVHVNPGLDPPTAGRSVPPTPESRRERRSG